MLLSKRKIELRERYFNDKEKEIIEREKILRNEEEQLQFDRDELLAKLDESSQINVMQTSLAEIMCEDDHRTSKGEELVSGIETREKMLNAKQEQFRQQSEVLVKHLDQKIA